MRADTVNEMREKNVATKQLNGKAVRMIVCQ